MFESMIFGFFGPFCARLASKFAKSANMTAKFFFSTNFDKAVKKRRIWIRWKSSKKVYTKKVMGLRIFVHSTERWKSTWFLHFFANNFFCWNFFKTFSTDSKSASNSSFFDRLLKISWEKKFCGHLFFANSEAERAQSDPKKPKIIFSNVNQNKLYFLILVSDRQVVKIVLPYSTVGLRVRARKQYTGNMKLCRFAHKSADQPHTEKKDYERLKENWLKGRWRGWGGGGVEPCSCNRRKKVVFLRFFFERLLLMFFFRVRKEKRCQNDHVGR